MKATTIIRIAGLTILMSLTSVGMANAQGNRGKTSENRQRPTVKYKINDRVKTSSQKAPTSVYKPSQKTKGSRSQGQVGTKSQQRQPINRTHQTITGHGKTHYKPVVKTHSKQYHGNVHHKTGGMHSSYNYNYNHHPVHFTHNYYMERRMHRYPSFTLNLPNQFFGFHIDGVRYYHNDGYFYTRHPQHSGFVLTRLPNYFRHIPAGSVKVILDGRVYFRYNNLFFRHTIFGFKLV